MTDTYGRRPITMLYAQIDALRKAIRAEGTQRVQDAWDKVEEHIDYVYTTQSRCADSKEQGGPDALDH